MRLILGFWLGAAAVLLVGAAYQLSPVDSDQNNRLATHDAQIATLNAWSFEATQEWWITPSPTQHGATFVPTSASATATTVPLPTPTPDRREVSVEALVTLWMRPTPSLPGFRRVIRGEFVRLDTSRCINANNAVYMRVIDVNTELVDGWIAIRSGSAIYVRPLPVCGG